MIPEATGKPNAMHPAEIKDKGVTKMNQAEYIEKLIKRARKAQAAIDNYSQEQVLDLARAIAYTAASSAEDWAQRVMNETNLGDLQSKINRINDRPRGILRDLLTAKTVGVIEEDKERQLIKIAKPIGVLGGIVPMTVPESVIVSKSMNSIMGRNAIIFCPHPRAKTVSIFVANELRKTLEKMGAPADLIICIEEPSKAVSAELMKQCDLTIATGGNDMVKAAYSSGKPSYGVGVGNPVSVIDETADLKAAAIKIMESQINDLATGCSTENALVIQKSVYKPMIEALITEKGHLLNADEKQKLQDVLWVNGHLNFEVICRSATYIAQAAGIEVAADCKFLMVEESGYGAEYPFSGEKLSSVLALYKYDELDDAIALVNNIQAYQGAGHSCGIHSFNEEHIMRFATHTKTSRVMVNSPQNKANAGNFRNGMPFTVTLACGTWGGNISNENINHRHYINTTWVARWMDEPKQPSDEILFGDIAQRLE